MGVVTGDGLSSLIRERFGVKITFYLMLALLVTNFGNIMAEFAGIASAAELFGIPRIIAVPICAFLVWYMVLRWSYRSVEKIFLLGCFFYVAYLLSAFMAKPDMGEIAIALVTPKLIATKDYMFMLIGIVGTTIAPWMQFYQQASIVEKGIDIEDYSYSRSDTILGGITVSIVAMCIVVVCAMTLHRSGISIEDASQAAQALAPLAGLQASKLFAFGLWNASMFAACILPLSTAYSICEALGWERGVDQRYEDAKQFYVLYTTSIILGALIVLIPGLSLMNVMLISQIVNGFLFTVILVFMLILVNDEKLMGKYTNSRFYNAVCFATVVVLALISVVSLFSLVL